MKHILTLLASLCLFPLKAWTLDAFSFFQGSQVVRTGVVVKVDARDVWFLTLDGRVERIGRYEVIGLAAYSLPYLPAPHADLQRNPVPLTRFETFHDGRRTVLAEGWPVAFDTERIQVLSRDGRDILVPRSAIWGVESVPPPGRLAFSGLDVQTYRYEFRHPGAFETYPAVETSGKGAPVRLFPHLVSLEPLAIKRIFDEMESQYRLLGEYSDRQKFFATPSYFSNRTYLGTWMLLGSRYSNVGARRANFLPYVQSQSSSGPFLFQYEAVSGVLPRRWGLHSEPMPQAGFSMKDAYVAFDCYLDPTQLLIGSRYRWSKEDLNSTDARLIEPLGARFAIDWKYVALSTGFTTGEAAARHGEAFERATVPFTNFHLRLRRDAAMLEFGLFTGKAAVLGDRSYLGFTARGEMPVWHESELALQYVLRTSNGAGANLELTEQSHELATMVTRQFQERWRVQVLAIVERTRFDTTSNGRNSSVTGWHPKAGAGFSLYF